MSNIIKFPNKFSNDSMVYDTIDTLTEEAVVTIDTRSCYTLAEYVKQLTITGLEEQTGAPRFEELNFMDKESNESSDLFLITNLVYAMLLRFKGIDHHYHPVMDLMTKDLLDLAKEQTEDD